MHPRRQGRDLAFQTLFELESRGERSAEEALRDRIDAEREETGRSPEFEAIDYASRLLHTTLQERRSIDERIARAAPAFPIDQIATTDRVVLELAVHELLGEEDVPIKVAINEAVELAKTYGGENSGRFVNGVLGTIAEELSAKPRGNAAAKNT